MKRLESVDFKILSVSIITVEFFIHSFSSHLLSWGGREVELES